MFDGTFPQNDEPDWKAIAGEKKLPWQLSVLLLTLVVANCLAAVFCPDVATNPGLKF